MKTKSNVQKTILKSLALIVSLVIITFTVNAQGLFMALLEPGTIQEIALVIADESTNSSDPSGSNAAADTYLEEAVEPSLEMENWMLSSPAEAMFTLPAEETESALELEDWMTTSFDLPMVNTTIEPALEKEMEVESWMLENENFEVEETDNIITGRNFIFVEVEEEPLKLENWMTDKSNF